MPLVSSWQNPSGEHRDNTTVTAPAETERLHWFRVGRRDADGSLTTELRAHVYLRGGIPHPPRPPDSAVHASSVDLSAPGHARSAWQLLTPTSDALNTVVPMSPAGTPLLEAEVRHVLAAYRLELDALEARTMEQYLRGYRTPPHDGPAPQSPDRVGVYQWQQVPGEEPYVLRARDVVPREQGAWLVQAPRQRMLYVGGEGARLQHTEDRATKEEVSDDGTPCHPLLGGTVPVSGRAATGRGRATERTTDSPGLRRSQRLRASAQRRAAETLGSGAGSPTLPRGRH